MFIITFHSNHRSEVSFIHLITKHEYRKHISFSTSFYVNSSTKWHLFSLSNQITHQKYLLYIGLRGLSSKSIFPSPILNAHKFVKKLAFILTLHSDHTPEVSLINLITKHEYRKFLSFYTSFYAYSQTNWCLLSLSIQITHQKYPSYIWLRGLSTKKKFPSPIIYAHIHKQIIVSFHIPFKSQIRSIF